MKFKQVSSTDLDLLYKKILSKENHNFMEFEDFINALENLTKTIFSDKDKDNLFYNFNTFINSLL